MRLGVGLDTKSDDPLEIARAYVDAGYSAAVCPPASLDQPERIRAIREAFARCDVMLAEVGVWNNMLDPDLAQRAANLEVNVRALALADEAFELTVQNVRHIIDTVKPKQTFYSIETMPWAIPDSADSYLRLVEAVDHLVPRQRRHPDAEPTDCPPGQSAARPGRIGL